MHLWTEIVARELAMLATLLALGIGPATFLGRRFDGAARVAIAPAFGLCLATCVFTTLIWFTAARNTYWLVPVLAAVSVAIALRRTFKAKAKDVDASQRTRLALPRVRVWDALSLVLVCVVVAAPLSYTLHERDSVGPTGFSILDADGYTARADGMEQLSLHQAERPAAEGANLVHKTLSVNVSNHTNVDASPLAANLELLIGLHATDTQSLFLIVFLVTDALGAFAVVRYFAPRPGWAAPFAGILFAGPLFLQLMDDGSQAATCGLAVMAPMAALGTEMLRERRLANLVLFALLASGLMALYPLYLPAIAVATVLVLATVGILRRARGQLSWRMVRRVALQAAIIAGLTIAFDVVSFIRDVHFWAETIGGENLAGKPPYYMALSILPRWVLQTRQFYALQPLLGRPNLAETSASEVIRGAVLPAVLIAVILFGLWRDRRRLILVSIILVFAALAEYASVADHCSYCVDRDTLPSAPLTIVLLTLGVVTLATGGHRWMRWSAIAVAMVTAIAVGQQTLEERQLFAGGAYFLGSDERELVSHLPSHAGPVDLEGFGENGQAVAEVPLVYDLVYEHNHDEVSLATEYDDNNSFGYFGGSRPDEPDYGGPSPRNPQLTPDYRYVLTRIGGVQTGRRVLARAGPLALEERTSPLDATIISGLAVPTVQQNARGQPFVLGRLHLLVVGGGSTPAWILLRFRTLAPAEAPPQPDVLARAGPHELTVCVRATGAAPVRRATVILAGTLFEAQQPLEKFGLREPPEGITLVTMRAVTHCSLKNGGE